MEDPFEDAAGFFYEVEPVGEGTVEVEKMDGTTDHYDKINFVVVDHMPFIFGMRAIEGGEFVPVGTYPAENVQGIYNNTESLNYIEDYDN